MLNASRKVLAAIGGVGVVGLAVLSIYYPSISGLDAQVSLFLLGNRNSVLDAVMLVVTMMADARVLIVINTVLVLGLFLSNRPRLGLASGAALALCALSVQLVKGAVQRERPIGDLYDGISAFSFPSGHTANSTATLLLLLMFSHVALCGVVRRFSIVVLLITAGLVGASRIYLSAHWLSDVIAGYFLALVAVALGGCMVASAERPVDARIIGGFIAAWVIVGGVHAAYEFNRQWVWYAL